MWEPLPLSSLDPAPARSPSSPERRATLPELELQQLEIGRAAKLGPGPGLLGPRALALGLQPRLLCTPA